MYSKFNRVKPIVYLQTLVLSIALLTLVFDDFGGTYEYDYYNHIEYYSYTYLGSGILPTLVLGSVVFFLGRSLIANIQFLRGRLQETKAIVAAYRTNYTYSLISLAILGLSALVFILVNIVEETQEWWFESASYIPFIAAIVCAYTSSELLMKIKQ